MTDSPVTRLREVVERVEKLDPITFLQTFDSTEAKDEIVELVPILARFTREVLKLLDTQVTMKTPARVFKKAVLASDLEDCAARALDPVVIENCTIAPDVTFDIAPPHGDNDPTPGGEFTVTKEEVERLLDGVRDEDCPPMTNTEIHLLVKGVLMQAVVDAAREEGHGGVSKEVLEQCGGCAICEALDRLDEQRGKT